jgi:hypothetical protein
MIIELTDFPVTGTPEVTISETWDSEDALTGLLRYWEDTASCNGVPCRLEYHDLPDGSQIVARFDVRGEVWQTLQITR